MPHLPHKPRLARIHYRSLANCHAFPAAHPSCLQSSLAFFPWLFEAAHAMHAAAGLYQRVLLQHISKCRSNTGSTCISSTRSAPAELPPKAAHARLAAAGSTLNIFTTAAGAGLMQAALAYPAHSCNSRAATPSMAGLEDAGIEVDIPERLKLAAVVHCSPNSILCLFAC